MVIDDIQEISGFRVRVEFGMKSFATPYYYFGNGWYLQVNMQSIFSYVPRDSSDFSKTYIDLSARICVMLEGVAWQNTV